MGMMPTKTATYAAEGLKYLQLETLSGDIELIGHNENNIRVEVFASVRGLFSFFLFREPVSEFDPETHELSISVVNESLRILSKPNFFNLYNWVNFQKTSFRIFLPKAFHSFCKTYGGSISLKNLTGNHTFDTWGGNLTLVSSQGGFLGKTMGGKVESHQCSGQIELKTFGGNILLVKNEGEIRTSSKGGNIKIGGHKGKINCSTWGGNIEASEIVGDFECNTAGGNIRLKNMSGNVGASTKGGNITFEMAAVHQYAWFDTAGGNIRATLPLGSPLDLEIAAHRIYHPPFQNFNGYASRRSLQGKLNGGGPNVTIKTSGGKVTLANTTLQPPQKPFYEAPVVENSNFVQETPPSLPKPAAQRPKSTQVIEHIPPAFNLNNFFFTLLFCLLLGYGLSAIVYFSLEFVNPISMPSAFSKGIFYSNIANSIATVCAIYAFIHFFDNQIRYTLAKYAVLLAITLGFVFIFQILVGIFYWNQIGVKDFTQNANSRGFFYMLLPSVVSCTYFFYWQRTRQITRKISEQEYQLLNLEKLKTKAQLNALEARINPHFLYNSLNSIAGLVHQDPDKAEEMTIQLSKLFRYTTGRNDGHSHTIAEELEVVKSYLAIEQMRFGNRLQFAIEVSPALFEVKIPRFLLQPLVENAIKHGISQLLENGEITIKIAQVADFVEFRIHDNGPAFKEEIGGGYGLRSIRDKLNLIYRDKASLQIQNDSYKALIINLPINHEWIDFK